MAARRRSPKTSRNSKQLAEIRQRTAASRPDAVQVRMRDTRRFVESRLSNLQSVFASEPVSIRAEIAKHVQKITLTPAGRTYVAAGEWDLLGSVAAWMVPGARIELATPAFSGRRSTTELPRQLNQPKYFRERAASSQILTQRAPA